jgi:hypothetical protein
MITDMNQGLRAVSAKPLVTVAEARGFEPRMGANPNRISSPLAAAKATIGRRCPPQSAQVSEVVPGKATEAAAVRRNTSWPSAGHHRPSCNPAGACARTHPAALSSLIRATGRTTRNDHPTPWPAGPLATAGDDTAGSQEPAGTYDQASSAYGPGTSAARERWEKLDQRYHLARAQATRRASLATSTSGSIENNGTPARTSWGVGMARCYARTIKRRSLGFWPPGAELAFS